MMIYKITLTVFFTALFISGCMKPDGPVSHEVPVIENIKISEIKDGKYDGYYNFRSLASANVVVTVLEGRIKEIRLLKHFHFPFISGAEMTNRIIKQQSLDVDSVTGATGSSLVVRKAVEIALKKGQSNSKTEK